MIRSRQKLGKYRVEKRLAEGGFAMVYQGYDTVEGLPVALKIPHERIVASHSRDDLVREVRVAGRLEHPNILSIKNASFIGKLFVVAYPLGEQTLGDRLCSRISPKTALDYAAQMIEAVAHAHRRRVVHCDIKPDNFIIFPGNRLRLTDFGISKVALRTRTVSTAGAGTVGYVAPEQALGKPSFRSDVFSLGIIIYRMLAGELPEWPYDWPPPGHDRLRQAVHPDFIVMLRRAIQVDQRKRFHDAEHMLDAFDRLRSRALAPSARRKRRAAIYEKPGWKTMRFREFRLRYGKAFEARGSCERCHGPFSERMSSCPWCGIEQPIYKGATTFPHRCNRCNRGMKADWRFCPWCYGPGTEHDTSRSYSDTRYTAKCSGHGCDRRLLMPHMRYCPWCHTKVKRRWKTQKSAENCGRCGWEVMGEFWDFCPWCGLRHN